MILLHGLIHWGGWRWLAGRPWLPRALLFVLMIGMLSGGVAWMTRSDSSAAWLQGAVAHTTCGVLNALGQPARVDGHIVASARFSLSVVTSCTGLFLTALFVAAVLAYPARWWASLAGVGIGVAGLFGLNVLRLVTLFFVGVFLPAHVETAHLLVLQSLLIVAALLLWLLWVEKVAHASMAR
jgi:exosortase/archaeosortase family protein